MKESRKSLFKNHMGLAQCAQSSKIQAESHFCIQLIHVESFINKDPQMHLQNIKVRIEQFEKKVKQYFFVGLRKELQHKRLLPYFIILIKDIRIKPNEFKKLIQYLVVHYELSKQEAIFGYMIGTLKYRQANLYKKQQSKNIIQAKIATMRQLTGFKNLKIDYSMYLSQQLLHQTFYLSKQNHNNFDRKEIKDLNQKWDDFYRQQERALNDQFKLLKVSQLDVAFTIDKLTDFNARGQDFQILNNLYAFTFLMKFLIQQYSLNGRKSLYVSIYPTIQKVLFLLYTEEVRHVNIIMILINVLDTQKVFDTLKGQIYIHLFTLIEMKIGQQLSSQEEENLTSILKMKMSEYDNHLLEQNLPQGITKIKNHSQLIKFMSQQVKKVRNSQIDLPNQTVMDLRLSISDYFTKILQKGAFHQILVSLYFLQQKYRIQRDYILSKSFQAKRQDTITKSSLEVLDNLIISLLMKVWSAISYQHTNRTKYNYDDQKEQKYHDGYGLGRGMGRSLLQTIKQKIISSLHKYHTLRPTFDKVFINIEQNSIQLKKQNTILEFSPFDDFYGLHKIRKYLQNRPFWGDSSFTCGRAFQYSELHDIIINATSLNDKQNQLLTQILRANHSSINSSRFIIQKIDEMFQEFLTFNQPQDQSQINQSKVFRCLIRIISHEEILIQIFANLVYWMLKGDKRLNQLQISEMQIATFKNLKICNQYLFHPQIIKPNGVSTFIRKQIFCIWQRLATLNFKLTKKSIPDFKSLSKSILTKKKDSQGRNSKPEQTQNPLDVFFDFFLFANDDYDEILKTGQRLFLLKKYKQCVFVVQTLNHKILQTDKNKLDPSYWKHKNSNRYRLEQFQPQICYILTNCYSNLHQSFAANLALQQPIKFRYKESRQSLFKKRFVNHDMFKDYKKKPQWIKKPKQSLIQRIVKIILNPKSSFSELTQNEIERMNAKIIYNIISRYFITQSKVKNALQFQQFYLTLMFASVITNMYYRMPGSDWMIKTQIELEPEKYISDCKKYIISNLNKLNIKRDRTFILSVLIHFQNHLQNNSYYCSQEKSQNHQINSFQGRSSNYSLNRLSNRDINISYIQKYYNALLQSEHSNKPLIFVTELYGDLGVRDWRLFQLQLIQKHCYKEKLYQKIILITDQIYQKLKEPYSQLLRDYVDLPKISYNMMIAQKQSIPSYPFKDFYTNLNKMIIFDKIQDLGGSSIFTKSKDRNRHLKDLKSNNYKNYEQTLQQLENQINSYYKIFRQIYDRYDLHDEDGLIILTILGSFYNTYGLQIVSSKVNRQFFLYYLLFLLEKINTDYFFVQTSGRRSIITQNSAKIYREVNKFVADNAQNLTYYLQFIIKRLQDNLDSSKNKLIAQIIIIIIKKFPGKSILTINFLKNYLFLGFNQNKQRHKNLHNSIDRVINQLYQKIQKQLPDLVNTQFFYLLINLAGDSHSVIPIQELSLTTKKLNTILKNQQHIPLFFQPQLYIDKVKSIEQLGSGKSRPLKIQFQCLYYQQLKSQSSQQNRMMSTQDLNSRNESRRGVSQIRKFIIKYNHISNYRMQSNSANFFHQLEMMDKQTTYRSLLLSKYVSILEFISVDHESLSSVLKKSTQENIKKAEQIMKAKQKGNQQVSYNTLQSGKDNAITVFNKFYMKNLKSVSYEFNEWWIKLTNYKRSLAYWSFSGYLTKLGDRHKDNILISQNCQFIHIDFQYNFGYGFKLPKKEFVPFRLTRAILTPMGFYQEKGLFWTYFLEAYNKFKANQATNWKALTNFNPQQRRQVMEYSQLSDRFGSVQIACSKIIKLSLDEDLLRMMFKGWEAQI